MPKRLVQAFMESHMKHFASLTVCLLIATCVAVHASPGIPYSWGDNSYGQLGDGTTVDHVTPMQVSGLTDVVAVSSGEYHNLAIRSDGTLWAWGWNYFGEIGDGTMITRTTPVQVIGMTNVVTATAGNGHSLAVKSDGTVWAWGRNDYGQVGDGTYTQRATPVQVKGLNGVGYLTGVTSVSAGDLSSVALKTDGTLWAWGDNYYGQLGGDPYLKRTTPVQVQGPGGVGYLTDVQGVDSGDKHVVAVKGDGTVWAWGDNVYGQLGDNTTTQRKTPVQTVGLSGVRSVSAGYGHSLSVKGDGTVWSWGYNNSGQLGDGTTTTRLTPVQVAGLTGAMSAVSGKFHNLSTKSDGTLWV